MIIFLLSPLLCVSCCQRICSPQHGERGYLGVRMLAGFAELSEGMFEMFPAVLAPISIPKVSEVSGAPPGPSQLLGLRGRGRQE